MGQVIPYTTQTMFRGLTDLKLHALHEFCLGAGVRFPNASNNNNNTNICKAHIISIRAESEVPSSILVVLLFQFLPTFYAALLPRRGPHIASHSVCPSVCLSVRPVRPVMERHLAPPSELQ